MVGNTLLELFRSFEANIYTRTLITHTQFAYKCLRWLGSDYLYRSYSLPSIAETYKAPNKQREKAFLFYLSLFIDTNLC